jgi:hypothetical protein
VKNFIDLFPALTIHGTTPVIFRYEDFYPDKFWLISSESKFPVISHRVRILRRSCESI